MESWVERFNGIPTIEEPLQEMLLEESEFLSIEAGDTLFGPGKSPTRMLLLLDGVVRVQQISKNGREIVLYRVHAGEGCVLTTACMFVYEDYSAQGIAETDLEIAAVPRSVFDELLKQSEPFRQFIFASYTKRISELFTVIEDVAFKRVDIRLAHLLLNRIDESSNVKMTQHQLATELGTAREVISRQLNEFRRRDWINISRGNIELIDVDSLNALAKADDQ